MIWRDEAQVILVDARLITPPTLIPGDTYEMYAEKFRHASADPALMTSREAFAARQALAESRYPGVMALWAAKNAAAAAAKAP